MGCCVSISAPQIAIAHPYGMTMSESASVVRHVQAADTATVSESVTVTIGCALWGQWGEIALDREHHARTAGAQALAEHRNGRKAAPALALEFLASLVAVSAAAHALDAIYGQMVTEDIKAAGPKDDSPREGHIRECLKQRFSTGKKDKPWVAEFEWLFKLRDAAVHAKSEQLPPVPHPAGFRGGPAIRRAGHLPRPAEAHRPRSYVLGVLLFACHQRHAHRPAGEPRRCPARHRPTTRGPVAWHLAAG
jgi:hypothetical protein